VKSILLAGLDGIKTGLAQATQNATRVISAPTMYPAGGNLEAAIDLQADLRLVEASTQVVRVGQSMIGATLDIIA
jgi:hypothetical protein